MSEETITFNVVYNVQNIDSSIRQTQRMLLFTNALRLSIVDIQRVMSGPTIANVLFTGIQLTRVWTTLLRLIKATNAEQAKGLLLGGARGAAGRGAVGAAVRRFAGGQTALSFAPTVAQTGLWSTIAGLALTPGGVVVVTALAVTGVAAYNVRETRKRTTWRRQQREIARSQGLEF